MMVIGSHYGIENDGYTTLFIENQVDDPYL